MDHESPNSGERLFALRQEEADRRQAAGVLDFIALSCREDDVWIDLFLGVLYLEVNGQHGVEYHRVGRHEAFPDVFPADYRELLPDEVVGIPSLADQVPDYGAWENIGPIINQYKITGFVDCDDDFPEAEWWVAQIRLSNGIPFDAAAAEVDFNGAAYQAFTEFVRQHHHPGGWGHLVHRNHFPTITLAELPHLSWTPMSSFVTRRERNSQGAQKVVGRTCLYAEHDRGVLTVFARWEADNSDAAHPEFWQIESRNSEGIRNFNGLVDDTVVLVGGGSTFRASDDEIQEALRANPPLMPWEREPADPVRLQFFKALNGET